MLVETRLSSIFYAGYHLSLVYGVNIIVASQLLSLINTQKFIVAGYISFIPVNIYQHFTFLFFIYLILLYIWYAEIGNHPHAAGTIYMF